MTDRRPPQSPLVAALAEAFPPVDPANRNDRRCVAVGDLTDAEMEAIMSAKIDPAGAYDLDDINEDGTWKPGRYPGWRGD